MGKFDLIVIGSGIAGLHVAQGAREYGLEVLLITKKESDIGGECLNHGCIPSKALIHAAKLGQDFSKARAHMKKIQEGIRNVYNAEALQKSGIELEFGTAQFFARNQVRVGTKVFSAKHIIVATGTRPRRLDTKIPHHTNRTIFDLTKLPRSLVVIGGGPMGVELGQAFHRLGSQVTLIHDAKQLLPNEPWEISDRLKEQLEGLGMRILLNARPKTIQERIILEDNTQIAYDELLAAIGREPALDELHCEMAGIKIKEGAIVTNQYLQTTNKSVFVCGDVTGNHMFTHAAEMQAEIILTNLFSPVKRALSYKNFSWVTFSDPEIASFGMREEEIDVPYDRIVKDFTDIRSRIDETSGRIVFYAAKGRILGGTMICPEAGEVMQELSLAHQEKIHLTQLLRKTYAYPVRARAVKEALSDYLNKEVSPLKRSLMKLYFRFSF
ncbi:MAG: dihydrolipoyl dehydrogenase family protein [Nanobdellota archaeon]